MIHKAVVGARRGPSREWDVESRQIDVVLIVLISRLCVTPLLQIIGDFGPTFCEDVTRKVCEETHDEDLELSAAGKRLGFAPKAPSGRVLERVEVPVLYAGASRACAAARIWTASSILSACLILPKATAASASVPCRNKSTTSRRHVLIRSTSASRCLLACCLVTPCGAAYMHCLRRRTQDEHRGRSPLHYTDQHNQIRKTTTRRFQQYLLSFMPAFYSNALAGDEDFRAGRTIASCVVWTPLALIWRLWLWLWWLVACRPREQLEKGHGNLKSPQGRKCGAKMCRLRRQAVESEMEGSRNVAGAR